MGSTTLNGRDGHKIELPTGLFIDNQFVPSKQGSLLDVLNPFSGEIIAKLAAAEAADVDAAVASATNAFGNVWKKTLPSTKAQLLSRLADLIERDADDFATIGALDGGFVFEDSKNLDIKQTVETLRYFAGWADKISGRSADIPNGVAFTRREPLGVCAAIVPWNAPLMITSWKLAPALASGNVLIIKTPELAPLFGQKLAQLIVEAGFPPGVVNILCGLGTTAGKALAEHMRIRKVAFTGSTNTGRSILRAAADSNLKKVTLELGGKSPSIVFHDANLENALFWTSIGSSANNGQVCALGSRIYVQDSIYDKFVSEFQARAARLPVSQGNPLQLGITKGPVISKPQHERILSYIEKGTSEGAKVLIGGKAPVVDGGVAGSGFVQNTILIDVHEDMTVVKEEVFGPVATIHRFKTEQEVIAKSNESEYGLSSAIFTNSIHRANRVSAALEAGMVTVNCWAVLNANMPFGGVKQSGFGRDFGEEALEGWTSVKSVKHWYLDEE